MTRRIRLGLDIGGTKIEAIVVDDDGHTVGSAFRLPTGFGAQAVVAAAVKAAEMAAHQHGVAAQDFESIGVGIPGTVDTLTGRVSHAVNLGLAELELGYTLEQRLGTQVTVENDVKAAALGAFHLLDDESLHSMAYLNLGTGLAAALILDGRLWRGSRGTAGEIGHIPVDPNGVVCSCGQRGCLETVASGSAVARQWPSNDEAPVRALFAAALSGDARAIDVKRRLVENVAAAIRIVILTVDVDNIVIGGGVSSVGESLLASVRGVLDRWGDESPFLAAQRLPERITLVPPGSNAAAVGAALVGRLASTALTR
jgi:glucokinase